MISSEVNEKYDKMVADTRKRASTTESVSPESSRGNNRCSSKRTRRGALKEDKASSDVDSDFIDDDVSSVLQEDDDSESVESSFSYISNKFDGENAAAADITNGDDSVASSDDHQSVNHDSESDDEQLNTKQPAKKRTNRQDVIDLYHLSDSDSDSSVGESKRQPNHKVGLPRVIMKMQWKLRKLQIHITTRHQWIMKQKVDLGV